MILCPDITREELDESIARLRLLAENTPNVSYAIGTEWVEGEYNIITAMQNADKNMYKDKAEYYRQHHDKNRRKNRA